MKFIPLDRPASNDFIISVDNLDWVQGQNNCGCSFSVLGSRLLNLSYPDYLKFCCSMGGELQGRAGYVIPYFKDKTNCKKICDILNKEWNKIKSLVEA